MKAGHETSRKPANISNELPMAVHWKSRKSYVFENGESAGIRTQDPRLKRAVNLPIYSLQINAL